MKSSGRSDQLDGLRELVDDQRFRDLEDYVPPLSLLGALGLGRDELAHSRLLAALFDPHRHQAADLALGSFLEAITERLEDRLGKNVARRWRERVADVDLRDVTTIRERDRIDVVIEIGGKSGVVIGIENKIDAGESRDQVGTYQYALAKGYPGMPPGARVMVFLTPDGRTSVTKDSEAPVPCVPLSYQAIADAANKAREGSGVDGEPALSEFVRHVKEDIMGDVDVKERARRVWKSHPNALRILLRHRPELEDIREKFELALNQAYGEDANLEVYPTRGRIREIKFSLESWTSRGCDFVFMLHTQHRGDADGRPRLRLLVRDSWHRQHREILEDLADRVNEADVDLSIDRAYASLPGWGNWRRVLKENPYPRGAVLTPIVIPGETDQEALDEVTRLVEELRSFVEPLPELATS